MKCARPFRVALVGELRRMLRSPGLLVAALVPLVLAVALLWYGEDAPRSTGDNYSLSLMLMSAWLADFWFGLACIPIGVLLTRAYGARLRQMAAFLSSRPIARRTAVHARVLALLIVASGVSLIALVALALAAPTSTRSEVPVVLYLDMLKASALGEVELTFPNERAAGCFEAYEARVDALPPGCRLFGVDVLEGTAPFVFLDADEGRCLDHWTDPGCRLGYYRRFSSRGTSIVSVGEEDRDCLEGWAGSQDPTCARLATRLLDEYVASKQLERPRGERRPDPGASLVGHRVTLVRASAEEQHCADAWAASFQPLREECYVTEPDRWGSDRTPEEQERAGELSHRKPRAFVHGVPAAVQIALAAGLWVLFWSLFGTAVGLRPAGAATTVSSILVGGVAYWLGASLGGPMSNLVVLGCLCLAAYAAVVALWTRTDLD
jgi:hypothetical protein